MSFKWDNLQPISLDRTREDFSGPDSLATRGNNTQDQVDRLTLACQAMWEIIRDRIGVTEQELQAKITEIDARDGAIDGKIGYEVVDCPECGQKTSTRRSRCVFCGCAVHLGHTFKA
ncbi:MAG: hypothetical protein JWO82_932 [Akkermansiaceae bacterium]|nr:hypothetical protein [Akkermansiaceae bacterium]